MEVRDIYIYIYEYNYLLCFVEKIYIYDKKKIGGCNFTEATNLTNSVSIARYLLII